MHWCGTHRGWMLDVLVLFVGFLFKPCSVWWINGWYIKGYSLWPTRLWCVLVYALLCLTVCHSYRAPLLCIWCLLAHYLLLDVIDSFVCCKYRCSRLTLSLTRSEAVLPVSVACCSLLHFLKHLRCSRTFSNPPLCFVAEDLTLSAREESVK